MGKVGVKLAEAKVEPDGVMAVTGLRAVAESLETQAVEPTFLALNRMSPKWYCPFAWRNVILSAGIKSNPVLVLREYRVCESLTVLKNPISYTTFECLIK